MRTACPAASRSFGCARLPFTRSSPLRMMRWIWENESPGNRASKKRSTRMPASSAATETVCTPVPADFRSCAAPPCFASGFSANLISALRCPYRPPDGMPNLSDLEQEFLNYAIEQAHPLVRQCAGERLCDNLLEGIRIDVDRITNSEFAKWHGSGREFFGEPVVRFNNRLLQFDSIRMIVGIRFRNRDNDFPFVAIEQSSVAVGAIEHRDRSALFDAIVADYRAFRPFAVRFHHPSHLPFRSAGTRGDLHVLMAPARTMAERGPPPGIDRIKLAGSGDLAFFDRYIALYEELTAARPWMRGVVNTEDRDSLEECCQQGLMFEIIVDDAWSGIVAGRLTTIGGIKGIQVGRDRAVKVSARLRTGRRRAEAISPELWLARDPCAIIWGTVADVQPADAAHGGTGRTRRCGRILLGGPAGAVSDACSAHGHRRSSSVRRTAPVERQAISAHLAFNRDRADHALTPTAAAHIPRVAYPVAGVHRTERRPAIAAHAP